MTGIVDFHVHSAPSLVPRHHTDHEVAGLMDEAGVDRFVLKAHEGSTAERAALIGESTVGGLVLNSSVGGANPDAVEVAARLGARVVWLPTLSSAAHIAASTTAELEAHKGLAFREVKVVEGGSVRNEWIEVLDLVAEHDMVLASGHLTMDETVAIFRTARSRGVARLLVNHPLLTFLEWRDEHVEELLDLGAYLEVGVLADILGDPSDQSPTVRLAGRYPAGLLVFGSDLGHTLYPDVGAGITSWLERTADELGEPELERITTRNGLDLLES